MSLNKCFLLFSGHNERAVIALCRYFNSVNLDFVIAASSDQDWINSSKWHGNVVYTRNSPQVDLFLFKEIKKHVKNVSLIYCPTTEYINSFLLENKKAVINLGYEINLPNKKIYNFLTSKELSSSFIKNFQELKVPLNYQWEDVSTPCVIKPKSNIIDGVSYYPEICKDDYEFEVKHKSIKTNNWFVQQYIEGQSYYLCGYLAKNGEFACFWQLNLAQQSNGKSMVLAKISKNPGFEEKAFFLKLQELGFYGPVMIELIKKEKDLFYIEINPRFWGPLQLAFNACPKVLDLFVKDFGIDFIKSEVKVDIKYYSWLGGFGDNELKLYPEIEKYSSSEIDDLKTKYDIYNDAY